MDLIDCLIGGSIVGLIIGIIILINSKKIKNSNDLFINQCIENYNECKNYSYGKDQLEIERYCIDTNKKQIYIFCGKNKYEKITIFKNRNIKDIIKSELSFNNEIVHSTNRGSQVIGAAIGGVAFGGVGAVIGGLTGSKTSKKGKILEAKILLYYNTPDDPMDILTFQKNGYEPLNDIEKISTEFYATILACMDAVHAQKDVPSDTRLCPFCAEEIKKAAIVCKHCGRDIPQDS